MGIVFFISLIGAAACAMIASNKNLNVAGYGVLGFFLPLIGVIIALCVPAAAPPSNATATTNEP